jgi:hypothetical protein
MAEDRVSWWIIGTIACLMISDVLHRLAFRSIERRLHRLEEHGG